VCVCVCMFVLRVRVGGLCGLCMWCLCVVVCV